MLGANLCPASARTGPPRSSVSESLLIPRAMTMETMAPHPCRNPALAPPRTAAGAQWELSPHNGRLRVACRCLYRRCSM